MGGRRESVPNGSKKSLNSTVIIHMYCLYVEVVVVLNESICCKILG